MTILHHCNYTHGVTDYTNLQIGNSMLKVGNASGIWRHVYIVLPSIRMLWNYCKNDLAVEVGIKPWLEPLPKAQSVTTLNTIQHINHPPPPRTQSS
jgi:hypothetical protein